MLGVSKLRPGQLEALLASMPSGGLALEVGTLDGVTAAKLAQAHSDATVWSVDPFYQGSPANWMSNRQPNQRLLVGVLGDLLAVVPGVGPFGMVFVDGDHRYAECRKDLDGAWALLRPTGRLWVHDYGFRGGVTKAVDEFCEVHGLRIRSRVDTLVEVGL